MALGAMACAGAFVDMRFLEPSGLKLSRVDIRLPRTRFPEPVRILHLSDMHASDDVPDSFIRDAFELGLSCKPDLVCLTGDFYTQRIPDRDIYVASLKRLSDRCPCYACPGNHDGGSWVIPYGGYPNLGELFDLLRASDVTVLHNSSETIRIRGTPIELVGLGDFWARETKPLAAFPSGGGDGAPARIVLAHNPDSKELLRAHAWDLMLCGHTHGGQLDLPLIGTPFAPIADRRHVYGLNEWNGRLIYTTRGIGNLFSLRFNCRPEVALLNVT